MIYFCVLREPNDIDEIFSQDLFTSMPELEVPMLEVEVKRLEKQGVDMKEVREKIEKLKSLSSEKNGSSKS